MAEDPLTNVGASNQFDCAGGAIYLLHLMLTITRLAYINRPSLDLYRCDYNLPTKFGICEGCRLFVKNFITTVVLHYPHVTFFTVCSKDDILCGRGAASYYSDHYNIKLISRYLTNNISAIIWFLYIKVLTISKYFWISLDINTKLFLTIKNGLKRNVGLWERTTSFLRIRGGQNLLDELVWGNVKEIIIGNTIMFFFSVENANRRARLADVGNWKIQSLCLWLTSHLFIYK